MTINKCFLLLKYLYCLLFSVSGHLCSGPDAHVCVYIVFFGIHTHVCCLQVLALVPPAGDKKMDASIKQVFNSNKQYISSRLGPPTSCTLNPTPEALGGPPARVRASTHTILNPTPPPPFIYFTTPSPPHTTRRHRNEMSRRNEPPNTEMSRRNEPPNNEMSRRNEPPNIFHDPLPTAHHTSTPK